MSGGLNWEKVNREKRMTYTPSWRVLPATSRQIKYIEGLAKEKRYKLRNMPTTKQGASDLIERLLALPDAPILAAEIVTVELPQYSAEQTAQHLREKFSLLPTEAQAFVLLCERSDPQGCEIFYDLLLSDEIVIDYEDHEDLVCELMGAFWRWRNGDL